MKPLHLVGPMLALAAMMGTAQAARLAISCGAVGQELTLCRQAVGQWAAASGNEVEVVSTPNSSTERLALYQQLLAAGAPDIDVFQIDVIWPGMLASHFIDLRPYAGERLDGQLPAVVASNTVGGKLVAMPWFTNAGVLYYRSDLLDKYGKQLPETWAQLAATGRRIQDAERAAGSNKMWGYVWQGRAYEGLTCDALEWVASHGGGTIVEADGKVSIDNPRAVKALAQAASWVGSITPEGVLNYAEEESRGVFQSGNAVFMRNWPYAWALAQAADSPVRGKVGVAPLPKGGAQGSHAATLGGWSLAVSRYSRHPKLSADLVMYLTSPAQQKQRAIQGAYNPTVVALYRDPEVLAANPFFGKLYQTLVDATARPSAVTGQRYNRVSNAFSNAVWAVLAGKSDAASSLSSLARQLNRLSRGGRRW